MAAPDIYADYIKTLVDDETSRRATLEQRGTGIVTTSGGLATLLFGLIGVITATKKFSLPTSSHGLLAAAIILFAVAILIGLGGVAYLPYGYVQAMPSPDQLADVWEYSESQAQAYVAATRLKILESARRANGIKAWLVLAAGAVQLSALVVLVFTVLSIINSRH